MPSPRPARRREGGAGAEPSPRKRARVPARIQAASRSSAPDAPAPRSRSVEEGPKAADGSGFGQRMRQRPLVVDKPLPVVTNAAEIPAGAMLDDGSAHLAGSSPHADSEAEAEPQNTWLVACLRGSATV